MPASSPIPIVWTARMIGNAKTEGDSRIQTLNALDSSHAKKGSNTVAARILPQCADGIKHEGGRHRGRGVLFLHRYESRKKISRLEAPGTRGMLDPFFRWLESTAVSVWIVESPSLFAFPGILAAHTVGLGLLAGLNSALDLRLLGIARSIPPAAFARVLPVMWFGLWVNVLSGIALVIAYPTKALTNPLFYLKLCLIAAALAILRSVLGRAGPSQPVPATTKIRMTGPSTSWRPASSGRSQPG
jgi:hypothetical protein